MIHCSICESSDWLNVDEYRLKPIGMALCKKCGFVTYPEIVGRSEELKEFYREEYRPAPTVQNVFTGQRKLHYHSEFLKDLMEEWKKEGRKPAVFEVGCAFGMFLDWFRRNFPEASLGGSELTLAFRRNAHEEYHIEPSEHFDDSKQYDVIASYKVAEHIPGIEKELRRYALALKPVGFLYISVPTWFHTMSNFGMDGFSLDYYYDKNHVNVWTRKLFETLLRKCGLEVVKKNTVYYDATYLCRRNDEVMKVEPEYDDPTVILSHLHNIKKAAMAFDDGDFEMALRYFPAFPDAHVGAYEKKRAEWHGKGYPAIHEEVLKRAMAACPESSKMTFFSAEVSMRYDQWPQALEYLKLALKQKPNDPGALQAIGHCYRQMAERAQKPEEKVKLYTEARDVTRHLQQVSFQHAHDAVTWIFADNAKIPMPGELNGTTPGVG